MKGEKTKNTLENRIQKQTEYFNDFYLGFSTLYFCIAILK